MKPTAALIAGLLAAAARAAQIISASDDAYVLWRGRSYPGTHVPGSRAFQWLGTAARVAHNGSLLRVQVASPPTPYKLASYLLTDNYHAYQTTSWVTAADAAPGAPGLVVGAGAGTFSVSLNVPADYWASSSTAGGEGALVSFSTDGAFLPAPAPSARRTLHILGDSITAATNVHGSIVGCADHGLQADFFSSWGGQVCNYFDADCTVVAVGGKGLVRNCCDDGEKVPDFYQTIRKTDGLVPGNVFPFNDTTPDAVIVYLGTNDYSGGGSPALDALFTQGLVTLFRNVTQLWYKTPAAAIRFFVLLGPMSPTLPANASLAAVAQATAAGYSVTLINATAGCHEGAGGMGPYCIGCAGHPGVAGHLGIAAAVLPVLESALGWAPAR